MRRPRLTRGLSRQEKKIIFFFKSETKEHSRLARPDFVVGQSCYATSKVYFLVAEHDCRSTDIWTLRLGTDKSS
jgi:hypothetical protein